MGQSHYPVLGSSLSLSREAVPNLIGEFGLRPSAVVRNFRTVRRDGPARNPPDMDRPSRPIVDTFVGRSRMAKIDGSDLTLVGRCKITPRFQRKRASQAFGHEGLMISRASGHLQHPDQMR